METMTLICQAVLFVAAAPFLAGLIAKIKNNLRLRQGQSVFQPYYQLGKLFSKGEVVSRTTSWIFRVAPFVVFASVLTAALLMPVFIVRSPARFMGDFLVLIFVFSLGRFFLALAALDAGSSFGGMGSSREMFISSLVEPAVCLAAFSASLTFGSTDLGAFSGMHGVSVSCVVAACALFMVTLAETSRIPVDNQETHLELTMVHEAMVLEYSGRSLALIEMASYVKQMIWFFLIAQILFPIDAPGFAHPSLWVPWLAWYAARLLIIAIAVALTEVSMAKMRLFRVADFLGFAFVLGVVAVVCAIFGI